MREPEPPSEFISDIFIRTIMKKHILLIISIALFVAFAFTSCDTATGQGAGWGATLASRRRLGVFLRGLGRVSPCHFLGRDAALRRPADIAARCPYLRRPTDIAARCPYLRRPADVAARCPYLQRPADIAARCPY